MHFLATILIYFQCAADDLVLKNFLDPTILKINVEKLYFDSCVYGIFMGLICVLRKCFMKAWTKKVFVL